MVKCMKFFDRISETLGLYEEEDDELLEEKEPVKKAETAPKPVSYTHLTLPTKLEV